ncbi:hypothetical protein [Sulfurimonas sp. HSL-1716]|uniref:hypothetical protein n=1 Tax=Hydrocurvibacter sulfurireducens TaxID=3131937 RepID=UPI0031F902FB
MLEATESIINLQEDDIDDNVLYYDYNIKHLLSLIKAKVPEDDNRYLSSFRSFEGEVFENYMYEKLLAYVQTQDEVEKFVLKGHHQSRDKAFANTLSISEKSQIVYRTKSREIGEFDALIFTKKELYFVEMTLVKSVLKLKKRLRKKKALLETIFPDYEIKALIILNEGVSGVKQLPPYCKVWITKSFSSQKVLDYLKNRRAYERKPKKEMDSKKMVEAQSLKIFPFRYYNTLSWITRSLRSNRNQLINMKFLTDPLTQRYHDLYTKIYLGFMYPSEFKKIMNIKADIKNDQKIIVALEKKHSDEIVLTYYIQYTRKKLDYISYNDEGAMIVEKKDPYGITVTEVYHVTKLMDKSFSLSANNIKTIANLLKESFASMDKR